MPARPVKSNARNVAGNAAPKERPLHPLPLRVMHWINAVAIFIMIGSGWKIYDDDVIFGWLHFPDFLTIGKWAQHGLQWHFFGMWIFVLNALPIWLTASPPVVSGASCFPFPCAR
jgi:thiosulfate reductase cytochrome b subunit